MPPIFLDNKKRNLILWLTDMTMAIASYFYITNPLYIQNLMNGINFAALRPDVDPEAFQSPIFFEFVYTVMSFLVPLIIGGFALVHTIAFYRCYLRKRAAIAYVKIYSFMAAVSLMMWLTYNFSIKNSLILIPAMIYAFVFKAERQPKVAQPAVDNILNNNG